MKKSFLLMGAVSTIIAPIAGVVSMNTSKKVHNAQISITKNLALNYLFADEPQNLQNSFLDWMNKKINNGYNLPLDSAAIQKFVKTNYYLPKIGTLSYLSIKPIIDSVVRDTNFSKTEKYQIARAIIRNKSFESFFDQIGVDYSQSSSTLIEGSPLIDPVTHKQMKTYQNGQLQKSDFKVVGKDIKDANWQAPAHSDQEVYDFSNQSIYNTFMGLVSQTPEIKKLINNDNHEALINQFKNNTKKLETIIYDIKEVVKNKFDSLQIDANARATIINSEFFQGLFDESKYKGLSNDDVYKKIMESEFGAVLSGTATDAQSRLSDYVDSSPEGKIRKQIDLIDEIFVKLTAWSKVTSSQLSLIARANHNMSEEKLNNLISIYSQLLNKTGSLTNQVQIKNEGNIYGHVLLIKMGIDANTPWSILENIKLETLFYNDESMRSYETRLISTHSIEPQIKVWTNVNDIVQTMPLSKLMVSSSTSVKPTNEVNGLYFSLYTSINNQNINWNEVINIPKRSNSDGDIQNQKVTTSTESVRHPGSCYQGNPCAGSAPYYCPQEVCSPDTYTTETHTSTTDTKMEFTHADTIEFSKDDTDILSKISAFNLLVKRSTTDSSGVKFDFTDIKQQLNNQYLTIYAKALDMVQNPSSHPNEWNNKFDPTKPATFKIQLKSINLGNMRFHVSNDGYSNFNFSDATATWDIILVN